MYSAQHTGTPSKVAMEEMYTANHILHGKGNVPPTNNQRKGVIQVVRDFVNESLLRKSITFYPKMNKTLSVTIVNDEIVNSNFFASSSMEKTPLIVNEDSSYIFRREEKSIHDLRMKHYKFFPIQNSHFELAAMNRLNTWHHDRHTKDLVFKNYINDFSDTYEDYCTIESHFAPYVNKYVNETEKPSKDNMTDASYPLNTDSEKRQVDIHEDTSVDVESFLMVSHSDVPTTPVDFVEENPMSRWSNVCRSVWNNLTSRLYCKTESAGMSADVKRCISLKPHHRRKVNAIALGRGRGRAKGQLRRSGVSQTVRRKKRIGYDDYDAWQNVALDCPTSNDCPLDSKLASLGNTDVPDTTQLMRQTNCSIISYSPEAIPTKRKLKARKKQKTAKYATRVRYVANPSRMSNHGYYTDNNNEMHNVHKDSFRLRSLSESSADSEDGFVVFEDCDDGLSEICEKRGATEYPTKTRCVPDSSTKMNNNRYEDSNSEIHDARKDSFRLRSLSESSADSEDSFIVFQGIDNESCDEQMIEYPKMRVSDSLTKINDEHHKNCNSQTQKNSSQHRRSISDSSVNSDDSFCIVFDTEEKCAADEVNGYETDETSSHDGDNLSEDESIISENDEDSEELTTQTRKVSFDLIPVVHVMVKWNYAYRAARKGPWEEIARDNNRFKGRINSIAHVLDPILKSKHRSQVWQERFASYNSSSPINI